VNVTTVASSLQSSAQQASGELKDAFATAPACKALLG